eukprot:CAMPEP_0171468966 /NCGR_PEP_ID=MMETSP0945-20130129/10963_1 /TAXON_ID=109269 /ORGANISM="Vaucheria litorea, Strain CCMP2940" /LENGTH=567 /DNA_ID=CAMNT_0011997939 /DNA_START=70 /DNA_END=1770 /DNA_ORIENTATION=+
MMLRWLGWKPHEVTFSSEYFDTLYEYAVELIRRGKAYVCFQTKDEIGKCREIAKMKVAGMSSKVCGGDPNSPYRNRPIEESLSLFDDMKSGKFKENEATLRLKIDMNHPNPNMWDPIAYRIKFMAHPHIGEKWCIYPTYDFTHCLVDSIEHIDYSICTLEFETRRESYYWLLEALNIYRPKVYEFSRLNLTYTVLSKRKLLKLVNQKVVRGWDDPRMPTLKGLCRRGYSAEAINSFCNDIGISRNDTLIEVERLQFWARTIMNDTSVRAMACLNPLIVRIENIDSYGGCIELCAPLIPMSPEKGMREIKMGSLIYIDKKDFQETDSDDYYGLAPGKLVGLKYIGTRLLKCASVKYDGSEVKEVICSIVEITEDMKRPKGTLSWVPFESALKAEIRLYNHLFNVPVPDENWEEQINAESEVIMPNAVVDDSVRDSKPGNAYQFERIGFFVVDNDSSKNKMIFNRTVMLREGSGKEKNAPNNASADASNCSDRRSRKKEQMAQAALKEKMQKIPPGDMFRKGPDADKYSAFDKDGIPTHLASNNEPLSKSTFKKLKKEWEKQKKLYEQQ